MAWSLTRHYVGRFLPSLSSPAVRWFSSETAVQGRTFAAVWGNGDFGRLGLGGLESQWKPRTCTFFDGISDSLVSLSCGGAHTLFLTETGRVFSTGLNDFGQLGINSSKSHSLQPEEIHGIEEKVVEISAGYHHSCAVTGEQRSQHRPGSCLFGAIIQGANLVLEEGEKRVLKPTMVDFLVDVNVKTVSLGSEHSIALTDEGQILTWGSGESGRLGHGHNSSFLGLFSSSSEYTPRLIKNFDGIKVKSIAAGLLHSACIDEKGSVFTFGQRTAGKMGFTRVNNASILSPMEHIPFSVQVSCGGYHTCVITYGGELYTWGSNENGCLGLGDMDMVDTPQHVSSLLFTSPISQVSCGWKHTVVISGDNVFTWGWGGANGSFFDEIHSSGGQLGHGNDVDYFKPTMVNLGENVRALHVSCGFNHTGGIFEYI